MMDRPLIIASGQALALLTAALQRAGVTSSLEFSASLDALAVAAGGTESEEGQILSVWARLIGESDPNLLPAEIGAQAAAG